MPTDDDERDDVRDARAPGEGEDGAGTRPLDGDDTDDTRSGDHGVDPAPTVAEKVATGSGDHGVDPAPAVAGEVLAAVSSAMRAITLGSSLDRVLHRLAGSARDLVGSRYAAIGVPEAAGDRFARFVTVGMSDELVADLGPLPRTHGLLDAMLVDPTPYRTADITTDPRFRGWWPAAHPEVRSFLGVPIVSAGDVIGAFYLTDKEGASSFTAADEAAVVLLASHAVIAIDQATLFEDSRELALVQERARLARELHDAMCQSLFSLQLATDAATRLLDSDPAAAARQLDAARALSGRVSAELRSTVEGLRPADLGRDGLVAAQAPTSPWPPAPTTRRSTSPSTSSSRLSTPTPSTRCCASPRRPSPTRCVTRRPAASRWTRVGSGRAPQRTTSACGSPTTDGGFDPGARGVRSRRLGLTSMHERAASIGGGLTITSAPGEGTTVELRFPA